MMASPHFSDSDDERDAKNTAIVGVPAYSLDAWTTGTGGPQCSQKGDFCYFCAFNNPKLVDVTGNQSNKTKSANDDLSALWDIVDVLVEQNKELPYITTTVYNIYNKHVRPHVKYIHPKTSQTILKPVWTTESITAHLLFSRNYPQLFDNVVEHIFQSLIYRQNNSVIDPSSMTVIEDRKNSLMDTITNFSRWKSTLSKCQKQPKAGKRRAANNIKLPSKLSPVKDKNSGADTL